MPENVSVLIVNQSLPEVGILVNAAFVVGLTAGRLLPDDSFGPDTVDGDGNTHLYLTRVGHYVRKATATKLRALRKTFTEIDNVRLVDYTEDAAPADYEAYTSALSSHREEEINYRAIHVYGPADVVIPLTKNLSRL